MAVADPRAICIYFPAGSYRFASSLTAALSSSPEYGGAAITIRGDGSGVSRLLPDDGVDGLTIRLAGPQQSFHIRDLSVLAGQGSGTATGIVIMQDNARLPNPAQSDITGVSVHGSDGIGMANRFARGLSLYQVSNLTLTNVSIVGSPDGKPYAAEGICLVAEGTAEQIPVQINIVASQFNYCATGIEYGAHVQGIQIVASNFVGNRTAIHQPADNRGNDQLSISASQFNSGMRNIFLEAAIDGVSIAASDFYLSPEGAVSVELPGVQFAIQGNTFIQLGSGRTTALAVGPYMLAAGVVTGNSFDNFDTAIALRAGSRKVNVQSNAYSNIAANPVRDEGAGNRVGGGSP